MKRRVCVVTGTRAEYGLLRPLLAEIVASPSLELQLVATGAHLSAEHGATVCEIEGDGHRIDERVEMLLSSDSDVAVCKSMGLALISFAEVFGRLYPHIVLGLGDRYELFAALSAASVCRRRIGHIHGGELTEGAFDDAFRHAITKLSHLHFTSTEVYRQRVIQLGESPDRVFNVGALGVDNICKLPLLERADVEREIDLTLSRPTLLVTFHPVTLEPEQAPLQCRALLDALESIPGARFVFTGANADPEGRIVRDMVEGFVRRHADRARSFASLGVLRYLSLMRQVDAVVGNSSSGILEAPSLGVPTVDIGDRQRGRVKADSVIECPPRTADIAAAITRALTPEMRARAVQQITPYGDGHAAEKIREALERIDVLTLHKTFHDLGR